MKHSIASAVILISLLLCGCNQSRRQLPSGYSLERFDEGGTSYYVVAPGKVLEGGGAFDGTVHQIGWNNDWILAYVNRIYGGDTNGWYVLNLKTSQITGPFQDAELKTNLAFSSIKTVQPVAVFSGNQ